MTRLGEHRVADARASGRSLSLDQAIDRALSLEAATNADTRAAADGPHPMGLTQRELEVVQLVADGKTNREIAEALVLSDKTVKRHLDNVFSKLGVSSRTAAAAVLLRSQHS
jgi:DNA-binding NarL/FixJ family response regulator